MAKLVGIWILLAACLNAAGLKPSRFKAWYCFLIIINYDWYFYAIANSAVDMPEEISLRHFDRFQVYILFVDTYYFCDCQLFMQNARSASPFPANIYATYPVEHIATILEFDIEERYFEGWRVHFTSDEMLFSSTFMNMRERIGARESCHAKMRICSFIWEIELVTIIMYAAAVVAFEYYTRRMRSTFLLIFLRDCRCWDDGPQILGLPRRSFLMYLFADCF